MRFLLLVACSNLTLPVASRTRCSRGRARCRGRPERHAALADDDRAGRDELAVAGLHAEPLADAVAAVLELQPAFLWAISVTRPSSWRVVFGFGAPASLGGAVSASRAASCRCRRPSPLVRLFAGGLLVGRLGLGGRRRSPSPRRRGASASVFAVRLLRELGGELGVLGGLLGGGLLEALALGLRGGVGLALRRRRRSCLPSVMSAMRRTVSSWRWPFLTRLRAFGRYLNEMSFSPRAWRTTSALTAASATSGVTDRRLVAVGDEQDAIERDRLARLDVEQLDLELGADLDAVLLPAGLDDCVHGSSGVCGGRARRPRRGHGKAPG